MREGEPGSIARQGCVRARCSGSDPSPSATPQADTIIDLSSEGKGKGEKEERKPWAMGACMSPTHPVTLERIVSDAGRYPVGTQVSLTIQGADRAHRRGAS